MTSISKTLKLRILIIALTPIFFPQIVHAKPQDEALGQYNPNTDISSEDWQRILGKKAGPVPQDASALFKRVAESVVLIETDNGTGSGSFVGENGVILTNHHVIEDAKKVFIALYPGPGKSIKSDNVFPATVILYDEQLDLALLKINRPPKHIKPIDFADVNSISIGSQAYAIGHPRNNFWSMSSGIVSNIYDSYKFSDEINFGHTLMFQTPISPGNSGGPLFNAAGQLIAVNTLTRLDGQNINFGSSVKEVVAFMKREVNRKIPPKKFCEMKALKTYRNSSNDSTFIDVDLDCDGKVDAVKRVPMDESLGIRYTVYSKTFPGKLDRVYVDSNRDGLWDFSLRDTNGDGVPDSIGLHPDGSMDTVNFVDYRNEAQLREILRRHNVLYRP